MRSTSNLRGVETFYHHLRPLLPLFFDFLAAVTMPDSRFEAGAPSLWVVATSVMP